MLESRFKGPKSTKKRIRLTKYMKPYAPLVVLAIALLFAQAYCDLSLPNYLSDIVNTGIQQGGVDSAVPVALRNSTMSHMGIFMTPANRTDVIGHYTFVNTTETGSPNYATYITQYPVLATESIYVRNSINGTEIARLNPIIARAIIPTEFINQLAANDTMAATFYTELGLNSTVIAMLTSLSPDGLFNFFVMSGYISTIENMINSRLAFGETVLVQAASSSIKAEYEALGMDTTQLQLNYILGVGGMMLVLTLLSMVCTIAVSFLAAKTASGMSRDIRKGLFEKVENFSSTEFDTFSTASLITRSTNDITQIQTVIFMIIRMVLYAPIIGIGGIIMALNKASNLWWIIAMSVLILVVIIVFVFYIALPKFKAIQKMVDRLNLVARESLTGMMVIRAFNKQEQEENRFDKANVDLTRVSLFINRLMSVIFPVMMLLMNVITITIIWIGSNQVAEGTLQVGDMIAFMQYTIQIVFAFLMMSVMFIMLPRASVSATRIVDVLSTKPVIVDAKAPKKFPEPFSGSIEFRDVCFRYPGAEVDAICNITFAAKPGQTTAIIGPTGAGKSTIVNLIPRFYDATSGSILIDGIDIREVTQHDLRDKIGYVPQKSALFSGTIESNLRYADEAANGEMLQSALQISQAAEFVASKPEGLAAEIAQGGMNVSGGQKQRLSIARAIVKKPPIYLLDDSFSALDFKTDAALRRAFKQQAGGSTLIIVTQRVSTIKNAEQIIVLENGKIAGKGTHAELMSTCEIYKEIAMSQMNTEALV